jgi:hypothetical protein
MTRSSGEPAMNIEFSIWLASKTRWAQLTKLIPMPLVPRVGEYMKLDNARMGDYFAWKVTQVTYRESGEIEVWTELLNDAEGRGYSFESEDELDEYFESYLAEGWQCPKGIGPNTRYRGASLDGRRPGV